ncbi:hypothetical protein CLOM_g17778 [Closterium sp. NIES-68]|nr:hypothetical protein CLOM_g17778 [Closterium sp. NIES-68]
MTGSSPAPSAGSIKTTVPFNGVDFYSWSFEFELLAQSAGLWPICNINTTNDTQFCPSKQLIKADSH